MKYKFTYHRAEIVSQVIDVPDGVDPNDYFNEHSEKGCSPNAGVIWSADVSLIEDRCDLLDVEVSK